MSSISEVVGALQEADSVCIVAHLRPDADALGSMATLRLGLEQLGKKTRCVVGPFRRISLPFQVLTPWK